MVDSLSMIDLIRMFPDDDAAEAWFVEQRWPMGIDCPKCSNPDIQEDSQHPKMPYRCRYCGAFFSVKTDTVMHGSKLGYQVWAIATYLITTHPKGISSIQLSKMLNISQKAAWHLAHRIRESFACMQDGLAEGQLEGEVEVDEAYFGGREKNKHARRKLHERWREGKMPVMGALERWSGQVFAKPIPVADTEHLMDFVCKTVKPNATVFTDEHRGYNDLEYIYKHETVAHSRGEYVRADVHTNSIESFWAILKRGYIGTHHWMSRKHLHRYVNEFSARFNSREQDTIDRMVRLVRCMEGVRATYDSLTQ